MARYHINPDNEPKVCSAKIKCEYETTENPNPPHFNNKKEATEAASQMLETEAKASGNYLTSSRKTPTRENSSIEDKKAIKKAATIKHIDQSIAINNTLKETFTKEQLNRGITDETTRAAINDEAFNKLPDRMKLIVTTNALNAMYDYSARKRMFTYETLKMKDDRKETKDSLLIMANNSSIEKRDETLNKMEKLASTLKKQVKAKKDSIAKQASAPTPTEVTNTIKAMDTKATYSENMEKVINKMGQTYQRYPGTFSTGGSYSEVEINGSKYKLSEFHSDYGKGKEAHAIFWADNTKMKIIRNSSGEWTPPQIDRD